MSETTSVKHRLLIVDDHPLFREGLRQIIERDPDLTVCGEAAGAAEALQAIFAEQKWIVEKTIADYTGRLRILIAHG